MAITVKERSMLVDRVKVHLVVHQELDYLPLPLLSTASLQHDHDIVHPPKTLKAAWNAVSKEQAVFLLVI